MTLILLILLPILVQSSCCTYCTLLDSNNDCAQCNSGYCSLSGICVLAPYGYTLTSTYCTRNPNSLCLIDTDFSNVTTLNASIVGNFTSQSQGFLLTNGLIPTENRGFYAKTNSYLLSQTAYTLGPLYTILFYIYPLGDGIILTLGQNQLISYKSQSIIFYNTIIDQSTSLQNMVNSTINVALFT